MAFDRTCLTRLTPGIHEVGTESVSIVETDTLGKGTFHFDVSNECLCIRPPGNAVKWMADQDCADGFIFEFVNDGVRLHLVELKSTVDAAKLAKVKRQFLGAYYNARFMAMVLGIGPIGSVLLHLAYTKDKFSAPQTANPSLLKTGIGRPRHHPASEWNSRTLSIADIPESLTLNAVQRDTSGNARTRL